MASRRPADAALEEVEPPKKSTTMKPSVSLAASAKTFIPYTPTSSPMPLAKESAMLWPTDLRSPIFMQQLRAARLLATPRCYRALRPAARHAAVRDDTRQTPRGWRWHPTGQAAFRNGGFARRAFESLRGQGARQHAGASAPALPPGPLQRPAQVLDERAHLARHQLGRREHGVDLLRG